jgi:hypothetical protein
VESARGFGALTSFRDGNCAVLRAGGTELRGGSEKKGEMRREK